MLIDKFRGCLLGLASGDALGTSIEFMEPGSFEPVYDMVGGGPFNLKAGQWTDDTSLALCLAESMIEKNDFSPLDQLEKYVRWWKEGYHSSNGEFFDIGGTTRYSLQRFIDTGEAYTDRTDNDYAGNGSLMRLGPVPLFYGNDPEKAIFYSGESSKTTHGASTAVDACRYFAGLIVGAINGVEKEILLSERYCPIKDYWTENSIEREIDEIASGSFKTRNPPEIRGTGHVVRSLEAALWAFNKSTTFKDGCLLAVNLGDDADTTGAVYGQIAGAYYGEQSIPSEWRTKLAHLNTIENYANKLFKIAYS
jgi:ADP-ribosyl-[dinitrogen reductase] hydrolase